MEQPVLSVPLANSTFLDSESTLTSLTPDRDRAVPFASMMLILPQYAAYYSYRKS